MDRIAIIADIHGNLEALKTVLTDIEKRNIKKIICLGDIIGKGAYSHECLELIKEKCEVVIKGNNDDFFVNRKVKRMEDKNILDEDYETLNDIDWKRWEWQRQLLDDDDKKYLKALPYCYEFYLSGSLIRLFHATPERINGYCSSHDKLFIKYKMFEPTVNTISNKYADVVIFGHTHTNYTERIYNRTLINVGSVGNSLSLVRNKEKDANIMETTRAVYLILEGELDSQEYINSFSYQFVQVPYDIDKEIKNQKDNIELDSFIMELKEGMYRDMNRVYKDFESQGLDIKEI